MVIDFIPRDILQKWQEIISPYRPEQYTQKVYNNHIQVAYDKAMAEQEAKYKDFGKEQKRRPFNRIGDSVKYPG